MNNSYSTPSYGKLFIIPQNKEDRDFLEAVDQKTKFEVADKYHYYLDYTWQANTIANSLVETIIQTLTFLLKNGAGNGVGIDFFDLYITQVSIRHNEKAEKEGNINIIFEPGKFALDLIANGPDTDEEVIPPVIKFSSEIPEENDLYKNIEYQARYALTSNHGQMFPSEVKMMVFAIGYTFIKNIFVELLYRLANISESATEDIEQIVSVNFNDNIEFHAIMTNGTVKFSMRPGMNAKLLIKCDELTENTMGDD